MILLDTEERLAATTDSGRRLCAVIDELGPYLAEQAADNDRTGTFAAPSLGRLRDAGVLAACVPEADGGWGIRSLAELGIVVGRLAEHDASVAVAAHMHLALSWYYARIVRCAPDSDLGPAAAQWLRAIGRREMVVCSAVSEPGRTVWQPDTSAVGDGAGWSVNGRKAMASISPMATHFYTRVRVETADGPRQGSVMIPRDAPGVQVRDNWDGLGLRGSGSGEVLFTDVLVPASAISLRGVWGERDSDGLEGRVAALAPLLGVGLGIAEAARALAVTAYRKAPAPAAAARCALAEIEVEITAARTALRAALERFDAVLTETAPRTLPAEVGRRLMKDCACTGQIVERAATRIVDLAMQLCGARSYLAAHELGRLCRDVRAAFFMRPYFPADGWVDLVADVVADVVSVS